MKSRCSYLEILSPIHFILAFPQKLLRYRLSPFYGIAKAAAAAVIPFVHRLRAAFTSDPTSSALTTRPTLKGLIIGEAGQDVAGVSRFRSSRVGQMAARWQKLALDLALLASSEHACATFHTKEIAQDFESIQTR